MKKWKNNTYAKNLRRIIMETILSAMGASFSVATITLFWNSIGMDQAAIGFVQMMFTIAVCLLDIPMGYIADRCNRKLLNIVGDIGVAFTFLFYAFSDNMYMVLVAECLLGIFMAMTNGVDQAFIKYNCDMLDKTGNLFKKLNIKIFTLKYISLLLATIVGGFIAKYNLRLSILISFVPYFIGGIIAIRIKDFNVKLESKQKNLFKDFFINIKTILADKTTRAYLFSYILGQEITHPQIWIFTPLLIMVGVPIQIVSIGWVINYIMQIVGSKISEKMVNLKTSYKFAIPMLIQIVWLIIIVIEPNIITIWLFSLNGLVHGLFAGNMTTSLQEAVSDKIQSTIISVASTGSRLLYIPLVYIINYLGNIQLQLGLLGVVVIFFPLCLISFINLKKLERR